MFSSKENSNRKVFPKFYVGWNKAKVEKIEIKDSSGERKRLLFRIYGEPVTQEGFKPFKRADNSDYHGQCGTVVTNWFDPNTKGEVSSIMTRVIIPMLKAYGVEEVFNQEVDEKTEFSDFVQVLNNILTGNELPYVWMNFSGEEYERPGKPYPGYNLFFRGFANDEETKAKFKEGTMKKLNSAPTATETNEFSI